MLHLRSYKLAVTVSYPSSLCFALRARADPYRVKSTKPGDGRKGGDIKGLEKKEEFEELSGDFEVCVCARAAMVCSCLRDDSCGRGAEAVVVSFTTPR